MGNQLARQFELARARQPVFAIVVEQDDLVVVRADRGLHEVRREQRQLFAPALGIGVLDQIFRFGGKPTQNGGFGLAVTLARISGFGASSSVRICASFLIFCSDWFST